MKKTYYKNLELEITKLMKKHRIPGLSISTVYKGEPNYKCGFGARDLEHNLPMNENTLIGMASISKSICALAIMQLVDKNILNLEEPIENLIGFKLGHFKKPITLHHLLSHTSGVPELETSAAVAKKATFIPMSSIQDFLLYLENCQNEQIFPPGEFFMYNNDMYKLLSYIIELKTGLSYSEYVKKRIFSPLKMNRSFFSIDKILADQNVINGYTYANNGIGMKKVKISNHHLRYGCGGMFSTANDMQKFLLALSNSEILKEKQIITNHSLELMWNKYISTPKSYGEYYGYGFEIHQIQENQMMISHGGNIPISGGYYGVIPDLKMGVFCAQIPNPTIIPKFLVKRILADFIGKSVQNLFPTLAVKEKIKKFTGNYVNVGGTTLNIRIQGGIVKAEFKSPFDEKSTTVPLVIENLNDLTFWIPFATSNMETKGQVLTHPKTGKQVIQMDRYLFHKIS